MEFNRAALQIIRFGVVGVLATIVHVCVALLMNEFVGASPLWANLTAFMSAFPVSYLGNFFWTFGNGATNNPGNSRSAHLQSIPKFAVASLSGLMLSQTIVWFVAVNLGYGLRIALIPALLIVPAFSFLISRFWVFQSQEIPSAK